MDQTLYIGLYGTGYRPPWSMLGVASTDGGRQWEISKGRVIGDCQICLEEVTLALQRCIPIDRQTPGANAHAA